MLPLKCFIATASNNVLAEWHHQTIVLYIYILIYPKTGELKMFNVLKSTRDTVIKHQLIQITS